MVWACCWRSVDTRTYNAARIGGSFLLCCRRRRPTQHQLVRPIPPRLPVRLFAGLPPDLEGAPHGRPPAAAVSLGRATPAGLPLPQRPPPPVQTKLAMTGPAELVTCDQTIEHTFRLFKQTLGWTRPQAPHPPGRRPLDLAGHRLPHPAPPRSAPHRRPAPSLGEARGPGPPHPRPGPPRIPEHPREDHPPSRYTKTLRARPGTPTWLQEPPRRTTLRRWKDRETGPHHDRQTKPDRLNDKLTLRSSKAVDEDPPSVAWGRWWAAPHPRAGAGVELAGRHPGVQGDLLGSGKRLPSKGLAAKQPPPALLQVQPAGPLGDEGVLDPGVVGQPRAGAAAAVAGQVVGDHHDGPGRVGGLDGGQQLLVADRVAGRCGHRHLLPVADAQRAIHPGPLRPTAVVQQRLDPVAVRGPAGRGREAAGDHRAELVGADHGHVRRRSGVAGDDLGSCGAKSGSVLVVHERVRRQRTRSPMRMRRTWLRPTRMPSAWARSARASKVQCAGAWGSAGAPSPSPPWCRRPGGAERVRAMIRPRSVSVRRRGRPGPGRSPSPSTPSALNRCSRSRTVCGWQPSRSAIWVVRRPSQLWAIIRARRIQSPGAWRAPASLRMVRSSAGSTGGRANSRTGTAAPSSARTSTQPSIRAHHLYPH